MKNLYILWTLVLVSMVSAHCAESPEPKKKIRILFVGNSLTYTNDLPSLVKKRLSDFKVVADALVKPNYALEDHWNEGRLQVLMASNQYDFVIVQQGPSSQQDGRDMLIDYGSRIKEICNQHQSQLVFFMVWPAYSSYSTFDGVIKNYTDAATETQSLLAPVGKIWKQYFFDTKDFSYYGPDMFHPSLKGSEVAADIIGATILNEVISH